MSHRRQQAIVRLGLPDPPVVAVVCGYLGQSHALSTISLLRLSCVNKEFFVGLERSVWKPLYLASAHGSNTSEDMSLGFPESKSASFRSKYLRRQSKETFKRRNRTMSEGAQYINGTSSATENSIIMEVFVIGELSQQLADLICTRSATAKASSKRETALHLADNTVVKCTIWALKDIFPDSEGGTDAAPGACVADAIVLTYQPSVMGSWTRMKQNLQVVQSQQAGSCDNVPVFLVALDPADDDADTYSVTPSDTVPTPTSEEQDETRSPSNHSSDHLPTGGAAQGVYNPDVLKSIRSVMKMNGAGRLEYRLLKKALQVELDRELVLADKDLLSHMIVIRVALSRATDDRLEYLTQRNVLERELGRPLYDFEKEEVTAFVVSSTGATGAVTQPNHGDYVLVADAAFFAKRHALHFIEVARSPPSPFSSPRRPHELTSPAEPEVDLGSIQSQANRVLFVVAATVVTEMRKQHAAVPFCRGVDTEVPPCSDDEERGAMYSSRSSWSSSHEGDDDFDFANFNWVNNSAEGDTACRDNTVVHKSDPPTQPQRDYVLCPMGHKLKRHLTHDNLWSCSYCRQRLPSNTVMFGCRDCNFDLCIVCNIRFTCHLKKMRAKKIEENKLTAAVSSQSGSASATITTTTSAAASSQQSQLAKRSIPRRFNSDSKNAICSACSVM